MARPLRIEFAGALYHITSRGDRREAIFEDDDNRDRFLGVPPEVVERYNWGLSVDRDAYLLALTRYVVLNAVRAGMGDAPEQWSWSSQRAIIGEAPPPSWLAVDGLLSHFGPSRDEARRRYRRFVQEGVGATVESVLPSQRA